MSKDKKLLKQIQNDLQQSLDNQEKIVNAESWKPNFTRFVLYDHDFFDWLLAYRLQLCADFCVVTVILFLQTHLIDNILLSVDLFQNDSRRRIITSIKSTNRVALLQLH